MHRVAQVIPIVFGLVVSVDAKAQRPIFIWDGESAGDNFGTVGSAGDVDADGWFDSIIGAVGHDGPGGIDAGKVYVYSGRTGLLMYALDGRAPSSLLGTSVSTIGDVNHDGFGDIIVGAIGESTPGLTARGGAYVYSGPSGALLHARLGESAFDYFGAFVAGLGDIDADHCDDLAVSAPYNSAGGVSAGRVYVYSGRTGAHLRTLTGEGDFDYFGYALCGNGIGLEPPSMLGRRRKNGADVSKLPNLIVGAVGFDSSTSDTNEGRLYLCSARDGHVVRTITGTYPAGSHLGSTVSALGDLDGDQYFDLVSSSDAGCVVYSGASGATIFTYPGVALASVSGVGDINGDDVCDFVGGDVEDHPGTRNDGPGSVYWFSGRTGRLLLRMRGDSKGDAFGLYTAGAGDVDHDGFADVLVGARLNNMPGVDSGRAYLFAGDDLFLEVDPVTANPNDTVNLYTRGGLEYSPAMLAVVDVGGTPTFVVAAIGALDAYGEWTVSGTVPSGLSGLSIDLVSFANRFDGKPADSWRATLTFN